MVRVSSEFYFLLSFSYLSNECFSSKSNKGRGGVKL